MQHSAEEALRVGRIARQDRAEHGRSHAFGELVWGTARGLASGAIVLSVNVQLHGSGVTTLVLLQLRDDEIPPEIGDAASEEKKRRAWIFGRFQGSLVRMRADGRNNDVAMDQSLVHARAVAKLPGRAQRGHQRLCTDLRWQHG